VIEAVTHVTADAAAGSTSSGRCVALVVEPLDHRAHVVEELEQRPKQCGSHSDL
jgi:hypothetical protein